MGMSVLWRDNSKTRQLILNVDNLVATSSSLSFMTSLSPLGLFVRGPAPVSSADVASSRTRFVLVDMMTITASRSLQHAHLCQRVIRNARKENWTFTFMYSKLASSRYSQMLFFVLLMTTSRLVRHATNPLQAHEVWAWRDKRGD